MNKHSIYILIASLAALFSTQMGVESRAVKAVNEKNGIVLNSGSNTVLGCDKNSPFASRSYEVWHTGDGSGLDFGAPQPNGLPTTFFTTRNFF